MFSSENAFSVNGKIFAMLTRGMFVVKLRKSASTIWSTPARASASIRDTVA